MPTFSPFDTIESAQDFVRVLNETVIEAREEIQQDFQRELDLPPSRHRDALQIALYNLEKLEKHMASCHRILNDLRSLRRLLFQERKFRRVKSISASPAVGATPAVVALIPPPKSVGVAVRSGPVSRRAIPA